MNYSNRYCQTCGTRIPNVRDITYLNTSCTRCALPSVFVCEPAKPYRTNKYQWLTGLYLTPAQPGINYPKPDLHFRNEWNLFQVVTNWRNEIYSYLSIKIELLSHERLNAHNHIITNPKTVNS